MNKSTRKSWIVVGGGFQGITAAYMLMKRDQDVTIVEKSNGLGAVLKGISRDGLFLDLGCHLFSNSDNEATNMFVEILDGNQHPVAVRYASLNEGRKVDGIAVMDFTNLPEIQRSKAVEEIINCASGGSGITHKTLSQAIRARFGHTLAPQIERAVQKITTHTADQLDSETLHKLPLTRVSILEEQQAIKLKKDPTLDAVLAVSSQADPFRFDRQAEKAFKHRNFYPSFEGTAGFCKQAARFFEKNGVVLSLNCAVAGVSNRGSCIELSLSDGKRIEADQLIWTLSPSLLEQLTVGTSRLSDCSLDVPLVLFYFLIPSTSSVNYTYLHDFTPGNPVYRLSSPGFYGKQTNNDGLSFLCAEVPTTIGSEIWANPDAAADRVWSYVRDVGMTSLERPTKVITLKTPISYPVYRSSFADDFSIYKNDMRNSHPRIVLSDPNAYAKIDIVRHLKSEIVAALQ